MSEPFDFDRIGVEALKWAERGHRLQIVAVPPDEFRAGMKLQIAVPCSVPFVDVMTAAGRVRVSTDPDIPPGEMRPLGCIESFPLWRKQ